MYSTSGPLNNRRTFPTKTVIKYRLQEEYYRAAERSFGDPLTDCQPMNSINHVTPMSSIPHVPVKNRPLSQSPNIHTIIKAWFGRKWIFYLSKQKLSEDNVRISKSKIRSH